jgi:hypothetical protein
MPLKLPRRRSKPFVEESSLTLEVGLMKLRDGSGTPTVAGSGKNDKPPYVMCMKLCEEAWAEQA